MFAKISGLLQEEFGRHSELKNSDKLEKYESVSKSIDVATDYLKAFFICSRNFSAIGVNV